MKTSWLVVISTLFTSALVVAVFVGFFNTFSWKCLYEFFKQPPVRHSTPSSIQIVVLANGDKPAGDVVINPENNPWIKEMIGALNNVVKTLSESDVEIDPEKNQWIKEMIGALNNVVKTLSEGDVEIDPEKNQWIKEMIGALNNVVKTLSEVDVEIDPENNPWINEIINELHNVIEMLVTDTDLRTEIEEDMVCGNGEKLYVSDYIRFAGGASFIVDSERDKIKNFICHVGAHATKWSVFGYASEPGSRSSNLELSRERACKVTKHLCNILELDCKRNEPDKMKNEKKCGDKSVQIFEKGEAHFINGVANSRSAVIAACKAGQEATQADDELSASALICTASN